MSEEGQHLPVKISDKRTSEIQSQKTGRLPLESKEAYEFLLDHSNEMILVLNKRGRIVFANKSALTTFGYPKEEITGKSITQFLTKNSIKKALFALAQEFLGHPQPELEVQAQTKSGEIRYLRVAEGSAPIRDDGRLIGVMISASDITEQRKARMELEESEKRFRDLWENAPIAYHTADLEGKITDVNQTEAAMLGYDKEELVGKSVFELILPDHREEAEDRFRKKIMGQSVSRPDDRIYVKKDGSKIYVAANDTLERDEEGKTIGLRSTLVDITKLSESEEALKKSEEHFKDLVERSGIAILIDDKEGNLKYFNDRYAEILGYSVEEMKRQTIWSTVHPDEAQKLSEYHRGRLEGKNVPSRYELKAQKKDGSIIYLELDVAVLKEKEQLIGTRTYMWDITERKQSELLQNAVYQISQAADTLPSLDHLYKSVHEIISTVMPAKNFYISLYNDKNDTISFPYWVDEFDPPPQPVKSRKGLTEYVLRTGRSLLCDEATDQQLRQRGDVMLIGTPSPIWLGVPLIVNNKPIGVMVVQHYSDPAAYGQRELRMLEYVSSQVAKSIERKRAEEAIRRQVTFDKFINKLLAQFANASGSAIDDHIRGALGEIGPFMGAENISVILASSDSAGFSAVYNWHARGSPDWLEKCQNVPIGTRLWAERRLLGGHLIQISALDDLPPEAATDRQIYEREGLKSLLEMPFKGLGGFVNGWISLRAYTHQVHWSQDDVQWLGIVSDAIANVLERKQAEESLKISEKKYRNLVENALVGIYQTNVKGQLLYVNEALAKMLEFESSEEMMQRSVLEIYKNLKDRELLIANLMEKGKVAALEIELLTKTGKTRTVLLSGTFEGDILSGMIKDITERKQAEIELRESETRYRELFDHVPVGLYRTTPGGETLDANPALLKMLGYPDRESMFKSNTAADYVNPMDRDSWKAALEKNGLLEDFENKILRQDGKVIWVKDSARVVKDSEGHILYYEGGLVDNTERKRAEEKLSHTVEMLRKNLGATIQVVNRLVEARDPYTAGHQKRVSDLARAIAKEMGLSQEQIDGIRIAGLIHDIGKVSVPTEILGKPGQLTELEFRMIKIHPQYGYEILKPLEFPGPVAQAVLQHHERIDGSGYPAGLKDKDILIEAKILAVADVFEAMISHRPYRPARSEDQALEEITKNKGTLYDPKVVDAFLRLLTEKIFNFREEQSLNIFPH